MESVNNGLLFSPSILVILGLSIFILAQLLSLKTRIVLGIIGIILIGVFFYKLKYVESNIVSIYMKPDNKIVRFTPENIDLIIIVINIGILCFWLFRTLEIAFSNILNSDKKMLFACSVIIMATSFLIYKIFGEEISYICFPILSIAYFTSVDKYFL